MTSVLNLTLLQLAFQRDRVVELPGLYAAQAPFRAARGRSGDTLVVHLSFDGTLTFNTQEHQKLIKKLAERYFKTSGSSTSATRAVAEWLNHFLVDRNQRGANRSIQSAGLLTQAVFRGDRFYLAQSGPTHTYLISSTGLSHYHISNLAWRGLGFTRVPEIRYHQAVLKPGDMVLISPNPPNYWDRQLLCELIKLPLDEVIKLLIAKGESDFEAGLVLVESGSGKLDSIDIRTIFDLDQLLTLQPIETKSTRQENLAERESETGTSQQVVSKEADDYHQGVLPFEESVANQSDLGKSGTDSEGAVSSKSQFPPQPPLDGVKIDEEKLEVIALPSSLEEIQEGPASIGQDTNHFELDLNSQGKIISEISDGASRTEDGKWSDLPRWTWLLVVGVLLIGIIGLIFLIFQGLSVFSPDIAGMILPTQTGEVEVSPTVIPSSTTLATQTRVVILSTPTSTKPPPTYTPTAIPTPKYSIDSTQISQVDGMVLAYVPAGVFEMGASEDDTAALRDENPRHSVNLSAFWLDQMEVTNGQYALCVDEGECRIPYSATSYTRNPYYGVPEFVDFPVVFVTWNDARDYCQWAGRRLPTEAEWEMAARGQEDRLYPWGDELNCDLANFRDCFGDTAEANSFPEGASPYGVLNMAGNVWEWVADWYYFAYYDFAPFENPTGPPSGAYRVIRGGSFNDDPIYLRTSSRYWYYPDNARFSVGFRCAISEYP